MKAVCILSGGLDSVVSMMVAKKETSKLYAITFDYGQRAVLREINASKKVSEILGAQHKVIKLPFIKEFSNSALTKDKNIPTIKEHELDNIEKATETMKSVWVPARNMILFSIASGFAEFIGADEIYTGLNREEGTTFPDNTKEFIDRFNNVLEYGTLNKVKMRAPLYNLNKTEIVKLGKKLEKDLGLEVLKYSYSCYRDNGEDFLHCGKCESCMRRKRAFKEAGINDPTKYLE
ncbi:7-cyano-7-deazaguanine synthase QueC [Methanothermococcus okinawensis]|uniref:7-cyano-7-deazaguanine synthase n=1 Tax=Methanothermococcus okinawensis (strain DSM 14208 / JCM 11175 / IH1) TaxID=647113 RepID=F8AKH1_METOI|nr:7-cyano-7-deazaguanine synthase QueC [Methanothermococcus okinawensis]AEH07497.1 exsB protein [Methanothermococcus okinawensis IH1]